jgi:hypothetical protein
MSAKKSETTAYALSLPLDMPVREVMAKIQARGLPPISSTSIYQARKRARAQDATAAPTRQSNGAPSTSKRTSNGASHAPDWEKQLMEAVLHLGVDRAAEILENTKRSYLGAL